MGRRASTNIHPFWIILLVAAFALTVAIGYFVFHRINDIFRTQKTLQVATYMDNANSLRGNVYKLQGKVANLINWSPDEGRLISVETLASPPEFLPVMVPATFNTVNLQRGQEFLFLIEVKDKGILHVQELKKI